MVTAIVNGALKEPFSAKDAEKACRGFGKETYKAFLEKHCIGNPGGNPELFRRTSPGMFELVRPFKYGT
jgi:hypothetical protein